MKGFTLCERAQDHISVRKVDGVWCVPVGRTNVPVVYKDIKWMEDYELALAERVKNKTAVNELLDRRVEQDGQPAMRMTPEQAQATLLHLSYGYPFKDFEFRDGAIHVLNNEDVAPGDDRALVNVAVSAANGDALQYLGDPRRTIEEDRKYGGTRVMTRYKDFPSTGVTKIKAGFDQEGISCCLVSMIKGASFKILRSVEEDDGGKDTDPLWKEMTVSWKWVGDRERKREFDRTMRKWASRRLGPKPIRKRAGLDLATYCYPS